MNVKLRISPFVIGSLSYPLLTYIQNPIRDIGFGWVNDPLTWSSKFFIANLDQGVEAEIFIIE